MRAGLDMVAAIGRLTTPGGEALSARVGIATGTVVVGELFGTGVAQERAVVGDAPNLAERNQGSGGTGYGRDRFVDAAAGRRRLRAARSWATCLKGYAEPIEAWTVVGSPAESRFEAVRSSRLTDFVGRERELEFLLGRKERRGRERARLFWLPAKPASASRA